MLFDERLNKPLNEVEFSEIPYESKELKELDKISHTDFLNNYPKEEHTSITEKIAYIRDYNLHFAICGINGPCLADSHQFYYIHRENILKSIVLSEKKFYNFELLQEQIRQLGLNPQSTFNFIAYLYYCLQKNKHRKVITYGERIQEILDAINCSTAEMTIKVGRKNFKFVNTEFIESMLTNYLDSKLYSSKLVMYGEKELKRESDYRLIKSLLDYLPINRTGKRGNYTQTERNFSLCVLYFCGSLLGDEYEVCINNNATFDKLMRDFKELTNNHISF